MDAKLLAAAETEVKRSGYDLAKLKSRIELPGSAWAKSFFGESAHNDYIGRIRQTLGDRDYRAVKGSVLVIDNYCPFDRLHAWPASSESSIPARFITS